MINNSAVECSILLRFVTDFYHMTSDVLRTFTVRDQRSRSQRENVVWSPNYWSVYGNRGSSNPMVCQNFDRKLTVSFLCAWAVHIWPKQPSSTGRLQVAVHCHAFQFFIAVNSKCIYYTSHVRTILICHIFAPMQTSEVFSNIHKRRLFVSALVVCVRII